MAKKKTVRKCPACGVEFEDPHMTICRYCGSVTEIETVKPRLPMSENIIIKDVDAEN